MSKIRKELEERYEEARQQAERATEALRNNLESNEACTESLTSYKYVLLVNKRHCASSIHVYIKCFYLFERLFIIQDANDTLF